MKDYIIFTVGSNYYALEVESVERIIQVPPMTMIPNTHPFIEGMMSYEKRVTKVVNFRRMTDMDAYEEEVRMMFEHVMRDHESWIISLIEAIENGKTFLQKTDPHTCDLGKWLDNYSTHDPDILAILKILRPIHSKLHEIGRDALFLRDHDSKAALELVEREIPSIFSTLAGEIYKMSLLSTTISSHLQKLLIYRSKESFFAIKVDGIEDITQIDVGLINESDSSTHIGKFLETEGVIEMNNKLVNVIKSISIPVKEVA